MNPYHPSQPQPQHSPTISTSARQEYPPIQGYPPQPYPPLPPQHYPQQANRPYPPGPLAPPQSPFQYPLPPTPITAEAGPSRMAIRPKSESPPGGAGASTLGTSTSNTPNATSPGGKTRRIGGKANVASACGPCKRAHLACDVGRPCKRCVNMGKEDQCEDVPHKKRGRPKVVKPSPGQPYSRIRQPLETGESGGPGKWKPGHGHSQSLSQPKSLASSTTSSKLPLDPYLQTPTTATSMSISQRIASPNMPPEMDPYNPPNIFTLFTTADLRILRCSATSLHLVGYHPNDFINHNFMDWLMDPNDRQLIENERVRLTTTTSMQPPPPPIQSGNPPTPQQPTSIQIQTDRNIGNEMIHRSDRELMTPAEGMREPYPNQNVKVSRSDHTYAIFNVRLHLGGGLGASLWRPESLHRCYLVISLLMLPQQPYRRDHFPPPPIPSPINQPMIDNDSRRFSQTPLTPVTAGLQPGGLPLAPPSAPSGATQGMQTGGGGGGGQLPHSSSLPSFSSIAAAADAPPIRYENAPGFYPSVAPNRLADPPGMTTNSQNTYGYPKPPSFPTAPGALRSPSPSRSQGQAVSTTGQTQSQPHQFNNQAYQPSSGSYPYSQQSYAPGPSSANYYENNNARYDESAQRRESDDWSRRDNGNGGNVNTQTSTPGQGGQSGQNQQGEYGRRVWE